MDDWMRVRAAVVDFGRALDATHGGAMHTVTRQAFGERLSELLRLVDECASRNDARADDGLGVLLRHPIEIDIHGIAMIRHEPSGHRYATIPATAVGLWSDIERAAADGAAVIRVLDEHAERSGGPTAGPPRRIASLADIKAQAGDTSVSHQGGKIDQQA